MGSYLKPVVFFSHTSKDRDALIELRRMVLDVTAESVEIFLSSDGESIPFGKNWLYKIEEALNQSKLMFIFLSSNSVLSNWVAFEAGHAYSKGINVVPVGIKQYDLLKAPPPFSLLQGFNINSEDGLNNILHTINKVFGFKDNSELFNRESYDRFLGTKSKRHKVFGNNINAISDFYIVINGYFFYNKYNESTNEKLKIFESGLEKDRCSPILFNILSQLEKNKIAFRYENEEKVREKIVTGGIEFTHFEDNRYDLGIRMDPLYSPESLDLLNTLMKPMIKKAYKGKGFYFVISLKSGYSFIDEFYKASSRIIDSKIKLLDQTKSNDLYHFEYGDIAFSLKYGYELLYGNGAEKYGLSPENIYVEGYFDGKEISAFEIPIIFDELFDKGLIYKS